ncbi:signal peptidase I, partial [bacterium]|nr:signal peptidase I [bacterium]
MLLFLIMIYQLFRWLTILILALTAALLINRFFIQAYHIPSDSMADTFLLHDRIFINKIIYKSEIIPGIVKLPGFRQPERGDIILFENSSYESKGLFPDTGPRFFIKRVFGIGGDSVRFRNGNPQILPQGFSEWIEESGIKILTDKRWITKRMITEQNYFYIRASAVNNAYETAGLPITTDLQRLEDSGISSNDDRFAWSGYRAETLYAIYPHERRYGSRWRKNDIGWYIP